MLIIIIMGKRNRINTNTHSRWYILHAGVVGKLFMLGNLQVWVGWERESSLYIALTLLYNMYGRSLIYNVSRLNFEICK